MAGVQVLTLVNVMKGGQELTVWKVMLACMAIPDPIIYNDAINFVAKCSSSCQNGGSCVGHNLCHCVNGWEGQRCERGIYYL